MKKEFEIKISRKSLVHSLENALEHPHSKLLARVIVGNLANHDLGIEQLVGAMNGAIDDPRREYKIGEEIEVSIKGIYTGQWDEQASREKQLILNESVLATIDSIDPYRKDSFCVSYYYMYTSTSKKKGSDWVQLEHVTKLPRS